MSYIALILRSESRFHVLVCADMCAVEINIEAFLRALSKAGFSIHGKKHRALLVEMLIVSVPPLLLLSWLYLGHWSMFNTRKDWKLEKWDLSNHNCSYRMSLFFPDADIFISSEQHHDTQLTVLTRWASQFKQMSICVTYFSLSLNIWPFLKHFS